jgi:6-pyruvoyltetrahydropterin/6-carboxytetrahydropterin synthase
MTMYLRRRAGFSAALRRPLPSDPRFKRGRGHDYLCELTVGGAISGATGMVINIKDVDAVLKAQVTGPLGGTLLDEDVPAFRDTPPTPEHLVRHIWDRCRGALPPEGRLARVTLWPAPTLRAELSALPAGAGRYSEEHPMLTVTRTYDFSASHRLHSEALSDAENADIFGKCNRENGHGHNYEVEVTLAGDPDPRTGQVWDLDRLDRAVDEEVLTPYDHRHLNLDAADFRALNPTSENLTRVIWDNLRRRLGREDLGGARLYRVAVRETARNYFEYYGE